MNSAATLAGPLTALTLLLLTLAFSPATEGQASQVSATANGQPLILVVEAGDTVTFAGQLADELAANATAYGWNFSRPAYNDVGNLTLTLTLHARGAYNVTFWAATGDERFEYALVVYVIYDREPASTPFDLDPRAYLVVGLVEMSVGGYLFLATYRLRQEKIYLRKATPYIEDLAGLEEPPPDPEKTED